MAKSPYISAHKPAVLATVDLDAEVEGDEQAEIECAQYTKLLEAWTVTYLKRIPVAALTKFGKL